MHVVPLKFELKFWFNNSLSISWYISLIILKLFFFNNGYISNNESTLCLLKKDVNLSIIKSRVKIATLWPFSPCPSNTPYKLKPSIFIKFIWTKYKSWFIFLFP
jgi:hypothetical protein